MTTTTAKAVQAADTPSAAPTELVTYGPYALPGEFSDIKVIFKTDIGVIAPELKDYRRDDPQLLNALRLGSGAMEVIKETGWGHIVPYAYAATYHFLGRLFYGMSTSTPMLPVTDCNRNGPGLQSARFWDHITCLYRPGQDHIICH